MIQPFLQDEAFLEAVRQARPHPGLRLWWLGQSGFLAQYAGRHLLIDPYLSDSLTKKYAGSDKPHVRMTARVVDPARLNFIDVVTSSHNHTDHLDAETLLPLMAVNPNLAILVSQANLEFAANRLNVPVGRLTGLQEDAPTTVGPFVFHIIPAAHETIETDEHGNYRHIGLVVQAGEFTLYHSGDCIPYAGLSERLKPRQVDIALLPINGRDPGRGVAGNFTADEAAGLAKEIGAAMAAPMHYEMFEFNSARPEAFIAAAARLGQPIHVLRAGEALELTA